MHFKALAFFFELLQKILSTNAATAYLYLDIKALKRRKFLILQQVDKKRWEPIWL